MCFVLLIFRLSRVRVGVRPGSKIMVLKIRKIVHLPTGNISGPKVQTQCFNFLVQCALVLRALCFCESVCGGRREL